MSNLLDRYCNSINGAGGDKAAALNLDYISRSSVRQKKEERHGCELVIWHTTAKAISVRIRPPYAKISKRLA